MRSTMLSGALAALLASTTPAAPVSGIYGGMIVAVVGDRVYGAFAEQRVGNGTEAEPQFSCMFMVHGRLFGSIARLVTQSIGGNEEISGGLRFADDSVALRLNDEPDGCAMTSPDMVKAPYVLERDSVEAGWIGAGLVEAKRVVLRSSPSSTASHRPYLVRGDAVAIVARRPDWIEVDYVGGARRSRGWVSAGALEIAGILR